MQKQPFWREVYESVICVVNDVTLFDVTPWFRLDERKVSAVFLSVITCSISTVRITSKPGTMSVDKELLLLLAYQRLNWTAVCVIKWVTRYTLAFTNVDSQWWRLEAILPPFLHAAPDLLEQQLDFVQSVKQPRTPATTTEPSFVRLVDPSLGGIPSKPLPKSAQRKNKSAHSTPDPTTTHPVVGAGIKSVF